MTVNHEIELAKKFLQYTNRSIFLTGKAGTGKTTFLHRIVQETDKRIVVLAPTGVAAINAGGVTIHSFFQMPFGPIIPGAQIHGETFKFKFTRKKIDLIRTLELLIIDEISMVRADLLDGIDQVLKQYRRNNLPFGGVQMLMIGDLQQLAPVTTPDEWALLAPYYETPYFFSAQAFRNSNSLCITLQEVYRQSDPSFLSLLEEIRNNSLQEETLNKLNQRFDPGFADSDAEGYITLTTHNATAHAINNRRLNRIPGKEKCFRATVSGTFPEQNFPTEDKLLLKEGAQVMFIKNDPSPMKAFYNGKIGTITKIEETTISIQCKNEQEEIDCKEITWENIRYTINEETAEITEQKIGSFTQFPLRLAWAITIHKSQGLTFDRVIIDAGAAFAHGQTYVALSRCRTLEGIILKTRITDDSIICDQSVSGFTRQMKLNQPTIQQFEQAKQAYQLTLLTELFRFKKLVQQTSYLHYFIRKNQNAISGTLPVILQKIHNESLKNLEETGEKFILEIHHILRDNPDAENNAYLQNRIQKASGYFTQHIHETLITPLDNVTWESDNSTLEKQLNEKVKEVNKLSKEKHFLIDSVKEKFAISEHLEARAKSIFQSETNKSRLRKKQIETKHPELYQTLTAWRKRLALEKNLPNYLIASHDLLVTITNELPIDKNHLLTLPGLGKKRVEQYGNAIITMVEDYCRLKDIPPGVNTLTNKKAKTKKPKQGDSAAQTYVLFRKGISIEEIAIARNLSPVTIAIHLVAFILKGELDVTELVDEEKLAMIQKYYELNPSASLKEAKAALSNDISYEELHYVLAAKKSEYPLDHK